MTAGGEHPPQKLRLASIFAHIPSPNEKAVKQRLRVRIEPNGLDGDCAVLAGQRPPGDPRQNRPRESMARDAEARPEHDLGQHRDLSGVAMLDFRAGLDFTDPVQKTGIKQRTALALRDEQTLAFKVGPAKVGAREQPVVRRQAYKQAVPPKNL